MKAAANATEKVPDEPVPEYNELLQEEARPEALSRLTHCVPCPVPCENDMRSHQPQACIGAFLACLPILTAQYMLFVRIKPHCFDDFVVSNPAAEILRWFIKPWRR